MTVTDKLERSADVCDYLGIPWTEIREPMQRLAAAADALGDSPHADILRVDVCHRIRLAQDEVFAAPGSPIAGYARVLGAAADRLEHERALPLAKSQRPVDTEGQAQVDVTAKHYGRLWGGFDREHYFDEATALLRARLERNGFDLTRAGQERVIDVGCGGGRYSVALKRLGFAEVIGVDWSSEAIDVANARVAEAKIAGVSYHRADVLELPFSAGEFDVIFSNGVLHHTVSTERGVDELRRVLKPNGRGWLYLYHRPGGLDRLTHYLARLILRRSSHEVCRRYCRSLGLEANRIFFLLDLWLTPIAEAYSPDEMDAMLAKSGFRRWRRCTRGADQDLAEKIHQGEPFADIKYGVGEGRYVIEE